ncbi:olfactory receptor 7C1-like [Octodon degus]|uniref:Olfactory receptor 7C1-like n=1 Tax=Octodon degus TaxID=10160 RepID=A0A6P3F982_OCTDE|nr:olfactory receptor 7C1-like [Octodon degus]
MEPGNQTHILEFLLLGFSQDSAHQLMLFGVFLSMYLVTVLGNLLIILAIISDSHLHTPMYFFLCNLSFADLCFTSTTIPKLLMNIQTQSKSITYAGCITQMYFFMVFGAMDSFLLTAMAYDRFVAICHPLHYPAIMNPHLCDLLVLVCWFISLIYSLIQSLLMLRLSFCSSWEIKHFYCELAQALTLACSDTLVNYVLLYMVTGLLGFIPLSGILFSYTQIVSSIMRISSTDGKYKAFSTCGSHLSVVSLFYGTGFGVYLSSDPTSSWKGMMASVMYTVVTPMLNPFIYSLRNRDIKRALQRILTGSILGKRKGIIRRGETRARRKLEGGNGQMAHSLQSKSQPLPKPAFPTPGCTESAATSEPPGRPNPQPRRPRPLRHSPPGSREPKRGSARARGAVLSPCVCGSHVTLRLCKRLK